MSTTLYRKHRPQKFAEVVSQNHVKVTLKNEIESGKLAHAFLFSGPRGIGKTTIARILAKSLNCTKRKDAEPCCNCDNCLAVASGNFLDLVEIDAASNRGINEIRELREQTKYTPSKGKYKVFIIDEVHMLTTEAFNALLKTLEEPPAHAVFVLATTEIHKIPETIISRCQRFDFKKVPLSEIAAELARLSKKEGVSVDKEVLQNIARASEGYLRDAISFLGQILSLGEKNIGSEEAALIMPRSDWQLVLKFIKLLFAKNAKENILLISQLIEEGIDLEHFTNLTIESLRKLLVAKLTDDWQEVIWEFGEENLGDFIETVKLVPAENLLFMIDVLIKTTVELKKTKIIQLPLEMAVVEITETLAGKNSDDQTPPPNSGSNTSVKTGQENKSSSPPQPKPVKTVSQKAPVKPAFSLSEISVKWPEVIESLKEYNHSLASFLMVGHPLDVVGSNVVVGFKYKFHCERVKEIKNVTAVNEVLKRVFQTELFFEGQVDENYEDNHLSSEPVKKKTAESAEAVNEVLNAFGGEVVG